MQRFIFQGLTAVFVSLTLITIPASATVLYVDDDAPAGGDGQSWQTAFRFLQDALSAARLPGSGVTEIRIGQGNYFTTRTETHPNDSNNPDATFSLIDGVAMIGGYAGIGIADPDERDPQQFRAAIRPDLAIDGFLVYHTMTAAAHKHAVILSGLTIYLGNATFGLFEGRGLKSNDCDLLIDNCDFKRLNVGSGFYLRAENSNVLLRSCTFGPATGGLYGTNCTISIEDCRFTDTGSSVRLNEGAVSCDRATFRRVGGAIHTIDGVATIANCSMNTYDSAVRAENSTVDIADCNFKRPDLDDASRGNGIYATDSTVHVVRAQFHDLRAEGGGAVTAFNSDEVEIIDCLFERNTSTARKGGAIWHSGKHLTLRNCVFRDNQALFDKKFSDDGEGGAVNLSSTDALIDNCEFEKNSGRYGGAISAGYYLRMKNCIVRNNRGYNAGGGVFSFGYFDLIDVDFESNTAWRGGAISSEAAFSIRPGTIANCQFVKNDTFGGPGGAVWCGSGVDPVIVNCTFIGNSTKLYNGSDIYSFGGAVAMDSRSQPTLANCTLTSNVSAGRGGAIGATTLPAWPTGERGMILHNCILFSNTDSTGGGEDGQIYIEPGQAGDVYITNSLIEGWTGSLGGIGNIGGDPLFIDIDGPDDIPGNEDDNLRLAMKSPCVDAGNNWALPVDAFDLDDDGNTTELVPLDLDGQPRIMNTLDASDVGCGANAIIDMGAYERPGIADDNVLFADLDGDGAINVFDLFVLLGGWASVCDVTCCLGDLNLDGHIDVLDLFAILSKWTN